MALQTYAYGHNRDLTFNLLQGNWSYDYDDHDDLPAAGTLIEKVSLENLEHHQKTTAEENPANDNYLIMAPHDHELDCINVVAEDFPVADAATSARSRRRRRSKIKRNQEEIENQRMTHIAVERNRRKQMNEYLSMLRGLMPDNYVLKGDQASIVGGAINYVKQLEQRLQFLSSITHHLNETNESAASSSSSYNSPFSEFFIFPQYSTIGLIMNNNDQSFLGQNCYAAADIEVTMVESHANLKVRSRRRPKQLLKMVCGIQTLRLSILHLNVTSLHQLVLYSLCLKVEDDCTLNSVDEIAAAVNEILCRIQEEASLIIA